MYQQPREIEPSQRWTVDRESYRHMLLQKQSEIATVYAAVKKQVPRPTIERSKIVEEAQKMENPFSPRRNRYPSGWSALEHNFYMEGFDTQLIHPMQTVLDIVRDLENAGTPEEKHTVLRNLSDTRIAEVGQWQQLGWHVLADKGTNPAFQELVRESFIHVAQHIDTIEDSPLVHRYHTPLDASSILAAAIIPADASYTLREHFRDSVSEMLAAKFMIRLHLQNMEKGTSERQFEDDVKNMMGTIGPDLREALGTVRYLVGLSADTTPLLDEGPVVDTK